MKGKLYTAVLILVLIAGLGLLLYPAVSDYVNSLQHAQLISQYAQEVEQLEDEAYRLRWEAAEQYNRDLLDRPSHTDLDDETRARYFSLLRSGDQELMCYIEIPSIGCTLPVAHGTEESTLQKAVGHLEWSSLPVGGETSHCVLSGHRGLPSSELFTNIDQLEIGDVFYLHVLGKTLEYAVDNIAVVEPHDFSLLGLTEGKDYTTLITCTPYGINSHRLLVRGIRVEREEAVPEINPAVPVETGPDLMLVIPVVLIALVALVGLILVLDSRKKKRKVNGDRR